MERLDVFFKLVVTIFGGISGYLFGGWSPLVGILLTFIIIDYVTGLIAAGYNGQLSSKTGFRGIAKKVMIFFIVAVAHLSDKAIGTDSMLMQAVIWFYLANEVISIIENAGKIGVGVPDQIKNLVEVLRNKGK
ncbi:phage holin family protein [Niallia alba]|uniref:phage holin family protein n=1 Tax=Niallia alba TaxID=2729105 RepID=UPI002E1A6BF0|nr:phage holin family protein [Niallia alba]